MHVCMAVLGSVTQKPKPPGHLCQQALEDQGEEMESAQASAVASAAASEDLHSSLEAQLRSSQADIGWLQSEVGRLKAAAAAAADAHSLAALHASRVTEAKAGLEQQLQRSQAEVVSLHKEVEQLKVAAAYAKAPSGASDAEQTATRRQRQEASMSEQNGTQADEDALPGVAPADQSQPGLQTELQQKLQATELERDKAKQQVSRCVLLLTYSHRDDCV